MKFLIALSLLAVASALPPRHEFDHRQHDDHSIDGPSSHENKNHQVNLIKLIYKQLIERLNNLSQDDNEAEESAINDIVDTITIIGQIIHDKNSDGDENGDYNSSPILQHHEYNVQEGDVSNKPPGFSNEVPPNQQDEVEKVPSPYGSKNKVISIVDDLPAGDSESSESLVDVFEDDESEQDVLSSVNQKDDKENHINIAYNSYVANEVPAL